MRPVEIIHSIERVTHAKELQLNHNQHLYDVQQNEVKKAIEDEVILKESVKESEHNEEIDPDEHKKDDRERTQREKKDEDSENQDEENSHYPSEDGKGENLDIIA